MITPDDGRTRQDAGTINGTNTEIDVDWRVVAAAPATEPKVVSTSTIDGGDSVLRASDGLLLPFSRALCSPRSA